MTLIIAPGGTELFRLQAAAHDLITPQGMAAQITVPFNAISDRSIPDHVTVAINTIPAAVTRIRGR